MTENKWAVVDEDNIVTAVIIADKDFIASLPKAIADPDNDTGSLTSEHRYIDITGKDPEPGVGWVRAKNGRLGPPVDPRTPEEIADAEAAYEATIAERVADDEFLVALQEKVDAGESMTDDEANRLLLVNTKRAGG